MPLGERLLEWNGNRNKIAMKKKKEVGREGMCEREKAYIVLQLLPGTMPQLVPKFLTCSIHMHSDTHI